MVIIIITEEVIIAIAMVVEVVDCRGKEGYCFAGHEVVGWADPTSQVFKTWEVLRYNK